MNQRGEYGTPLRGGSLFSKAPYGGSPAPSDGGWAYRGPRAFHGHEAPTYGRGGLWSSKREAPLGQGGLIVNGRGEYGSRGTGRGTYVGWGRELSDDEVREANEAAQKAIAPLVEERQRLMSAWKPALPLTSEQMSKIMEGALKVAHEVEGNLETMIDKVPSHWEHQLRDELSRMRKALHDEAAFRIMVADIKKPFVLPGFRVWINQLLGRAEDGVAAIAQVAHILPHWLSMRDALSTLYHLVVGIGRGVIDIAVSLGGLAVDTAKGARDVIEKLPSAVKWGGLGLLAVGGILLVSKVAKAAS